MDKKTKDLNLLIMYLNGWEEVSQLEPGVKLFRVWKGYPFEIINELERENLIRQYPRSMIITKEGQSKALGIKHQYLKA